MLKEQLGKYGENPHQRAWKKIDESYNGPTVLTKPLHGKSLGYNNLQDANSALEVMLDLHDKNAVVVIKHQNPCGLATGSNLSEAFKNAWYGDEVSAFGSVVGYSKQVSEDVVKLLEGKFVEVLVAPSYSKEALDWIKTKKSKERLRVIETGPLENTSEFIEEHKIRGGIVSQTQDNRLYLCDSIDDLLDNPKKITEPNTGNEYQVGTVTKVRFEKYMGGLIEFAIIAGKHTKSNAIILAYEYEDGYYRVLGMGAGQPNRKDSLEKLAVPKARENLMREYFRKQGLDYAMEMNKIINEPRSVKRIRKEIDGYISEVLSYNKVVLYSDAFFPFGDSVDIAASAKIKYIIQPGGSKKDEEVIKAANEKHIAMVFTGIRHFRH